MDAKITKSRLNHLLSYDWLKIIGAAAAVIVVWSLVFTMTATRLKPSQQFSVMNYKGTALTDNFSTKFQSAFRNDVFSYEVIETSVVDTTTGGNDMVSTLMETRLTTDEGDVLFAADVNDPDTKYTEPVEEGSDETVEKYYTYLESCLHSWYGYVYELADEESGYFAKMEAYLNQYYTNGFEDASSFDEEKVAKEFRAKVKANKDKRYRKSAALEKGVQGEVEKVKSYRDGLVKLYSYLDAGYIELVEKTVTLSDGKNKLEKTGTFAINLCPNEATMGELKDSVYYLDERQSEEDPEKTVKVSTAKDVCVMFVKTPNMDDKYLYESILYVNYLVETYCTEQNA